MPARPEFSPPDHPVPAPVHPAAQTRRATFAELFCAQRGVAPADYPAAAFRAALHPPARLFLPLLNALDSDFFAADHDLIANVGQLTSTGDLDLDFEEHRYHPKNQSRLRRFFLLSVSTERLSRLVRNVFRAARSQP